MQLNKKKGRSFVKTSRKDLSKCVAFTRKGSPITLRFYARLLSSIIYALISICASVISRGYQSTQLINCSHARTWGFMVQKYKVMVARECFCVSSVKIHCVSLWVISKLVYNLAKFFA